MSFSRVGSFVSMIVHAKLQHIVASVVFSAIWIGSAFGATTDETIAPAVDLRADLKALPKNGALILVVALSRGCYHCDVVKQNYLRQIEVDPKYSGRVRARALYLDKQDAVRSMDGAATTHVTQARKLGAVAAPTVLFITKKGKPAVDALVGGDAAGFYGAYLDRSIASTLAKSKAGG